MSPVKSAFLFWVGCIAYFLLSWGEARAESPGMSVQGVRPVNVPQEVKAGETFRAEYEADTDVGEVVDAKVVGGKLNRATHSGRKVVLEIQADALALNSIGSRTTWSFRVKDTAGNQSEVVIGWTGRVSPDVADQLPILQLTSGPELLQIEAGVRAAWGDLPLTREVVAAEVARRLRARVPASLQVGTGGTIKLIPGHPVQSLSLDGKILTARGEGVFQAAGLAVSEVPRALVLTDPHGFTAEVRVPVRGSAGDPVRDTVRDPVRGGIPDQAGVFTNSIGMKFRRIEAGSFKMGSEKGYIDERPVQDVTMAKAFYIGICEVTQAQWKAVMDRGTAKFKGDDRPMESVSWRKAEEFLKKLSEKEGVKYRLPTEREWEYACRAGTTTVYPWGDKISEDHAWYWKNSEKKTHPVGKKKPNAWGLHDMSGNVAEWCMREKKGPHCYARGGSWRHDDVNCRAARRFNYKISTQVGFLGFRAVLEK